MYERNYNRARSGTHNGIRHEKKRATGNVADNNAMYLGLSGDVILQIKRAEKVFKQADT